jgi:ribose 5-phosphate isomerase A
MSSASPTPFVAAHLALDWVDDGMIVGLGTGRAAFAFLEALGERVRTRNWKIKGIASSNFIAQRAEQLGIELTDLTSVESLDLTVDGADEVDPDRNVVKGLGGALLREKVLAQSSRLWLLCVGADKHVSQLGARGRLPVEVSPFAVPFVAKRLSDLGLPAVLRRVADVAFVTDNGNHILDCEVTSLPQPQLTHDAIRPIPGVVETGLFLGMSPIVITQRGSSVEVSARE